MEQKVFNKETLSEYEALGIGLENCDSYEISVEDILDFYCTAELIGKTKNEYRSSDGFIKISARASNAIEHSTIRCNRIGTELDHRLKERLQMCGVGADMTSFSLKDKNGYKIEIYVPYDPLLGAITHNEIELSNCPSLEIDSDGNMIIAFGKSSKSPKRKDNNYAEIISGWKDLFGDYSPEVLKVKMFSMSVFGEDRTNFSFCFNICDRRFKKDLVELIFLNCKDIEFEMFFPEDGKCKIVMSKMADGRIYVGFDWLNVEFICDSVLEYNYYCSQLK